MAASDCLWWRSLWSSAEYVVAKVVVVALAVAAASEMLTMWLVF